MQDPTQVEEVLGMLDAELIKKKALFIHITHTDLDGFGCRQVVSEVLRMMFYKLGEDGYDISVLKQVIEYHPIHSDYDNIDSKVMEAVKKINQSDEIPSDQPNVPVYILISDISFKKVDALIPLLNLVRSRNPETTKLLILDHHVTTQDIEKDIPEYLILDTNRCGTRLTADNVFEDIMRNLFGFVGVELKDEYYENKADIDLFADVVDAYDRYQEHSQYFQTGKFFNSMYSEQNISKYQYPKLYADCCAYLTNYLYGCLGKMHRIDPEGNFRLHHMEDISTDRIKAVHGFIVGKLKDDYSPNYHLHLLTQLLARDFPFDEYVMRDMIVPGRFTISGKDRQSKMLFVVGFPSKLMMEIKDFHFKSGLYDVIVTIDTRGIIQYRSLKTDDAVNVGLIAEAFGGGGHPCASGCADFKMKNAYKNNTEYALHVYNKMARLFNA